jgi:hypothetical protein
LSVPEIVTVDFESSKQKKLGDVVNLDDFSYVMKVIGKIHWGVFVIGKIFSFHFHSSLESSDSRS